ncbi:solute carrier family 22 member 15-like isoform X2 [Tubulanus polymorphus]|uniref:solute carrier family 22 member 15-like isoform X2 n=1 Tax=Tubulanus polymorphus TaxID=672921 RepID=UPI003DA51E16
MTYGEMDIDGVYSHIGEFGPRQKKIFFFLQLTLQPFLSFHVLHMIFIGAATNFTCFDKGGRELPEKDQCSDKCRASNEGTIYLYSSKFTSIMSEWNLVCDNSYKVGLVQSVFMSGALISAFVFGILADKYGRLKMFYYTLIGMTIFSTMSAFAPSYTTYVALRFFTGFHCGGCNLVSFVLMTEIIGKSSRGLCGFLMPIFFAWGILIYVLLAYYIRAWRHLAFVTSAVGFLGMFYYWLLPESPRWLIAQNRIEEAEVILRDIARRNGSSYPLDQIKLAAPKKGNGQQKKYSMNDIWHYPYIRNLTLVQIFSWFVNSAVYYGLTMSAGNLGSNMYISVGLSGLVEVPSYLFCIGLLNRVGRKLIICMSMLVGGVSCMLVMLIPQAYSTFATACALIGKLAIAASFAIIYVHSAEIFPTVIRNMALGISSCGARFGGIVAPMIASLSTVSSALPFLVFGCMAFSAGVLNFYLPETKGQPMPETIDDVLMMGPKKRRQEQQLSSSKKHVVKLLDSPANGEKLSQVLSL